jgi:hypothetical protein
LKHIYKLFFYTLLISTSHAEINETKPQAYNFDTFHADVSGLVLDWSAIADIRISKWMGYKEDNKSCSIKPSVNTIKSKSIDSFFQNNKYLEETNNIFIRLRTDTSIESRETNRFRLRFRAQLPFSRCREQLKIFIDNDSTVGSDTKKNVSSKSGIGLRYADEQNYGLKSRYSLGLSGVKPFIEARYTRLFKMNGWEIEPIQSFIYSTKEHFEEETNLYLDKSIYNKSLFRLKLERGTKSKVAGMHYGATFEYYFNAKENSGLRLSQSFYGSTKYIPRNAKKGKSLQTDDYSGINNYITSVSYRANIWRKWLYYELKPTVNFHRDHDYKANYALRFFFDFYFGEYN